VRHGLLNLEALLFVFQKSGQHVAFGLVLGFKDTCGHEQPGCTGSSFVRYAMKCWLGWQLGLACNAPLIRPSNGHVLEKYSVLLYTSYEYHEEHSLRGRVDFPKELANLQGLAMCLVYNGR
jgi:hypothetical protein